MRSLCLHKERTLFTPDYQAPLGRGVGCGYLPFHTSSGHGHDWKGSVEVTDAPFAIIKRLPISRRQLHLMVPTKGGKRRKYGGSTTRHGFRKGDLVSSPKGIGYGAWRHRKTVICERY